MSDKKLNEGTIRDWMKKANLGEQTDDFIQERKKKDPESEVLEEEDKKWSSEYQDKIEREMPDALYEMDGMEDEDEMEPEGGGMPPEEEPGMEEPEMGDEPEMGGEGDVEVGEIVRAIADAISSTTGMQVDVEGGEMGMEEPGMEEPEMGDEMPDDEMDMEEPEMGGGEEMPPEEEEDVLEEIVQGVMNEITSGDEE